MPLLSVVIPVYNEDNTVEPLLDAVRGAPLPDGIELEIVAVDDASSDRSLAMLLAYAERCPQLRVIAQPRNQGKGAALRRGFAEARGDLILIQDADLEYDPRDFGAMLGPVLDGHADVVYGSRFLGGGPHRVAFFWHYLGNRFLTTFSNMMTDLNLTDMEVGYKMFRREVLDGLRLRENRFGFEVEITAKVARGNWRIYEVPVAYYGRSYAEGKKITWRDGLRALWCIVKYRFAD